MGGCPLRFTYRASARRHVGPQLLASGRAATNGFPHHKQSGAYLSRFPPDVRRYFRRFAFFGFMRDLGGLVGELLSHIIYTDGIMWDKLEVKKDFPAKCGSQKKDFQASSVSRPDSRRVNCRMLPRSSLWRDPGSSLFRFNPLESIP